MLSVSQAEQVIRDTFPALPPVEVDLQDAVGEVLQESLVTDRPFPPFHRVTMDGVALSLETYRQGKTRFPIQGIQAAGQPPLTLTDPDHCIEIMTGAVLPAGCDGVVPVEDLERSDDAVVLASGLELTAMQHVHLEGTDRTRGETVIRAGRLLHAPEIALAATLGKTRLKVSARHSIAVISTGDELVAVNEIPEPHQLRRSNAHALHAVLNQSGFKKVSLYHAPDEPGAVKQLVQETLAQHQLILLSGGVSKGRFDFIPEALADCGITRHFHGVRQRPGKPLWYGTGAEGQVVFGLPGNPVSALVCCTRYVLPALQRVMGADVPARQAMLSEPVLSPNPLTLFHPVKFMENKDGAWQVKPVSFNTSGDLAALVDSDGFVQLDEEQVEFAKGSVQEYWSWG